MITNLAVPKRVLAATATWNLNTSGEYTYDANKIEFSGGVAQLKGAETPGVNWIAADGGGNNWGYRKKITFNNTLANIGVAPENMTDFKVLVKLNSSNIDYSKTQNAGQDIRFTDPDATTALKHEIAQWNESADSYVWVKVPQVDIGNSDYIYLYYGNSTVADGQDQVNVWNNYSLVYHLDESVGAAIASDSTENTTSNISANVIMGESGQVGTAANLASGTGISTTATVGSPTLTASTSVSFWVFMNNYSSPGRQNPFNQAYGGWGTMTIETNGAISWFFGSNGGDASPYDSHQSSSGTITNGGWIQITAVRNPTDFTYKWYKNGAYLDGSTYSNTYPVINSRTLTMGDGYVYPINGKMDEYKVAKFAQSTAWVAANYKSETDAFGTIEENPTTLFPTDNPTLVPNTGQEYFTVSAFTQTLEAGSSGNIKYQVSPDDGTTWYWYTGGAWTATIAGYTESNTAADINTHFADSSFNSIGSIPKTFKWRAYFNSDGSQQPKLDNLLVTYVWDTADPDNPILATKKSQKTGGTDITTNTWYNYSAPYFTWNEPADYANVRETISGIAGYYVYFGDSATGDPSSQRGIATELGGTGVHYQTDTDFEVSVDTAALSSGSTYYLRIETADNAGNIKHLAAPDPSLFIYKYDGTVPTSPVYVSVSPSGYTQTNSFTFSWSTTGGNAAADTGGSGLSGYHYKINTGVWSDLITGGNIALNDIASLGVNIFYLRAVDNATNYDTTPVQTNFYFNDTAPTCPTNLTVDPSGTAETNSFTFLWDPPLGGGEIAGYYYSINNLPTPSNVTYTTNTTIGPDAFASQQGENTFYIVAKDNAGNYDLGSCNSISGNPTVDHCAKINFYANTSAPGAPTGLQVFDISNRDAQEYATSLKWTVPQNQGTGFAGYEIYRSTNETSFTSVGTTSGTTYADTGLESIKYYYYVKSKDNAGQYSAVSSTVSITPTGKWTTPPNLTDGPSINIKTYGATISWETDRVASSFIDYGTNPGNLGATSGGDTKGQLDSVTKHSVTLSGLSASTAYHYQTVWVDSDGNQGRSSTSSFTTNPAPTVSEVDTTSNITLNSILVNWKTSSIANCSISYGTSSAYGGMLNESPGALANSHSLNIIGLDHSTVYHIQISCSDSENNRFSSDDYKESTRTMPLVSNFRFEPIADAPTTSLKFTWITNVETTSIVTYQATGGVQSKSDADYKINHELVVANLADKTTYVLVAKGTDRYGNSAESEKSTFTTPDDTRPPKISDLTVEVKSSGFGEGQKSQIIASWQTDEPASSQVEYAQGISGTEYSNKTKEDSALSLNHAVIVSELEPSKVYHLKAVSRDAAGNPGYSTDTTTITGKSQKSVIDIIIGSLEKNLGWLFRIFK